MNTLLYSTWSTEIKWWEFTFPLSLFEFNMTEQSKVATYEYAWRNWAEHERVLSYRVIKISGEFISWAGTKTPEQYVKQLRLSNDNKPAELVHPTLGRFVCIMKDLSIKQKWDGYSYDNGAYEPSYAFEAEFWEHTPPKARTLKWETEKLFPAVNPKPANDLYKSSLKYKNADELYNAILSQDILPWTDPIVNAEWLSYNFDIRKEAYDRWKAGGFKVWVTTDSKTATLEKKEYKVVSWDSGFKISKKFWVSFDKLFSENKWLKVRAVDKGTEGKYRKTAWLLYPWDVLIIPSN